jgi:RNA polymerase sigma-70 factor, ECF subfamily
VDEAAEAAEAAMVAAAQRDRSCFGALYEANVDTVYAFVARRIGSRADAEDVTATVFQKALANLDRFEWRGVPFAAWLVRIAANEIADRGRHLLPPTDADADADAASIDEELEAAERRASLFRLVRTLPDDQRRVLALRFAEDRPIREIAATLGRSEGAVKQLQFRALTTLRERLGDADV